MSRTKYTRARKRAILAGCALCTAVAVPLAPRPRAVREDPAALASQAESTIRDARSSGAPRRAPMNLAQAEEAYGQALLERRRQQLRPGFRRDYRSATTSFQHALERAQIAEHLTETGIARDRSAASRSVATAETRTAALAMTATAIWIPDALRRRLQRSRALAAQARDLLDGGAYQDAVARAREAEGEADAVSRQVGELTARFVDTEHLRVWRGWVAEAAAWSKRTGKTALVVDKDAHLLLIYQDGRIVREYAAELGWNNVGDKRRQGDGATPEGRYRITQLKGQGRSRYHKALLLNYPSADDLAALARLKAAGSVPSDTRAGGLIEIHGEGGRGRDWTDGCVAITNAEMDWLFSRVTVGTPVVVVGSRAGDGVFSDIARSTQR